MLLSRSSEARRHRRGVAMGSNSSIVELGAADGVVDELLR
jgi:phospholipid N-methyltransferase